MEKILGFIKRILTGSYRALSYCFYVANNFGLFLKSKWGKRPRGCGFIVLILLNALGWAAWYYGMRADSNWFDEDIEVELEECNPYTSEMGCEFDLRIPKGASNYSASPTLVDENKDYWIYEDTITMSTLPINGYEVELDYNRIAINNGFIEFPVIGSPYKLKFEDDKIKLRGDLHDFYLNAMLGWFNEDVFKIDKYDGGCAYTFCIDENGVEIYSLSDYDVIFSLTNTYGGDLRFAGSFEINSMIYVYDGEKEQIFRSKKGAKEMRGEIIEVFNFRKRDSLGGCKRVLYPNL